MSTSGSPLNCAAPPTCFHRGGVEPLDAYDLALFPQVVGLVTRKDLARYRLGKGGLEELSLAQT